MPRLPASGPVPVAVWAALVAGIPARPAQVPLVSVAAADWFHDRPNGNRIARLERGAQVAVGRSDGEWQAVTLEGVVWSRSLAPASASGYDLQVVRRGGENVRDRPNGGVRARILEGFLLQRVADEGDWTRVRREGWVRRSALGGPAGGGIAEPGTAASGQGATPGVRLEAARAARGAAVLARPDGDTLARLPDSVSVGIVSRTEGWVRVRLDGWMRSADVVGSDRGQEGVTPADLRANPEAFQGALVRWPVQLIAVRKADELRPDIPSGRRFILARGPLPEGEWLYIILPEERVAEVELLAPLSTLLVTARVRTARARYLGNPVLELIDMEAGAPR